MSDDLQAAAAEKVVKQTFDLLRGYSLATEEVSEAIKQANLEKLLEAALRDLGIDE